MAIVTRENPKTGKLERVFINDVSQEGPADYLANYEEKKLEKRLLTIGRSNNFRLQLDSIFKPGKLFFVHITDHFPKKGIIKTHGFISRKRADPVFRETIHFTINGGVGSHMMGNWDGKKYAIIIPWKKIIDRMVCINEVDSFTFGNLVLPKDSVIIYDDITYPRFKKLKSYTGIPGVKCLSSKDLILEVGKDPEKTSSIIHQAIDSFMEVKKTHPVIIGSWEGVSTSELIKECFKDPQELANPDFLHQSAIEFYKNWTGKKNNSLTLQTLMRIMAKSMGKMSTYHTHTWFNGLEDSMSTIKKVLTEKKLPVNTNGKGYFESYIKQFEKDIDSLKELKKKGTAIAILKYGDKQKISISNSPEEIEAISRCLDELKMLILGLKKFRHAYFDVSYNDHINSAKEDIELARKNEEYLMREFNIVEEIKKSMPPPLPGSKNLSIKQKEWDLIQQKLREMKRVERRMWRYSKKLYDTAHHDLGGQGKNIIDELDSLNSMLLIRIDHIKKNINRNDKRATVLEKVEALEELIQGEITKLKDFETFIDHMIEVRNNSFQKAA